MSDPRFRLSLNDVLQDLRRSFPGKAAVVQEGRRFTYDQLADRVERLANDWEDRGVGVGDRVLWLGQNSLAVIEGMLACAKLGAMFCPLNWRQSAAEVAFVIDDLEPKILLWHEGEIGETVRAARQLADWKEGLWVHFDEDGPAGYEGRIAAADPVPRERPDDVDRPCMIMYTAAFQGRPNGAMLSQRALILQNLNIVIVQALDQDTVFLNSGPHFHIGTLAVTFAVLHIGGCNVIIRRTETQIIAEALHNEKCTLAFLVPKTVAEINAFNHDGRYDLSRYRSISAPRPGDRPMMGFGQTEVTGLVTWSYYGPGAASIFGKTGPVARVRVLDDQGKEVPVGAVGELAVCGPTVCDGYWNRPEINKARWKDGWWRTNDIGRREADGSINFIGPKTQMIKSGVENIYPAEVEGCIKSLEGIADCAVIGVPDSRWVQSVKAIVVLKPGAQVTSEGVIEHCRVRIASYKKPRFVEFADALPRTAIGAIDYAALDARYGGGGYPGTQA